MMKYIMLFISEYLICRQCGADAADTYYVYDHFSPEALHVRMNQSIFGRTDVAVQLLENPFGMQFEVVTVAKALCANTNRDKVKYFIKFLIFDSFMIKLYITVACTIFLVSWIFMETLSLSKVWSTSRMDV